MIDRRVPQEGLLHVPHRSGCEEPCGGAVEECRNDQLNVWGVN